MKHRNSLKTWSKNPVSYSPGTTLNYNFTTNVAQAFGNNMIIVDTKSCLYSGDINQDANVTLTDVVAASNDAGAFKTGYVNSDVNGDKVVNLGDILIAFNNSSAFVSLKKP